jgi:hypothetical protein
MLSIVTPCLNRAGFLPRSLASVASQPVEPGSIEHIVIDGGSTDGSRRVIEAHAAAHPGVVTVWRSEPDRGQSDAINKGFTLARGEFGAWLNADDWFEPGALRDVLAALRDIPSADVVVGRCRFVDGRGVTVYAPVPPEPINTANLLRLTSRWFNGRNLVQPEVFFRLALFRAVGGLRVDNHYSMDHELWLEFLARGARFVSIDVPVACVGVHEGQKTRDNRAAVRSILGHSRRFVDRLDSEPGEVATAVRAELDRMTLKLGLADIAIGRWHAARQGIVRPRGITAAAEYDGIMFGDSETGRTLRTLNEPAESVHAAARDEVLHVTALSAPRGALRLLALVRGSGGAVARLVQLLPRRPIGISVAAFSQAGLAGAIADIAPGLSASRHRLSGSRIEAGVAEAPADGEAFEAILTDGVLMSMPDAGAMIGSLWSWLAPGGVLVQLAEPRPNPALGPYLDWLEQRMSRQLSTNDSVCLDPRADPFLEQFRLDAAMPHAVSGDEALADPWLAAHPGCMGVDVESSLAGVAPDVERLMVRHYGSLSFHPLTPFPFVGSGELGVEHGWTASAWRKRGV